MTKKELTKLKAKGRAIKKNLRSRAKPVKSLYIVSNDGAGAWEVGALVLLATSEAAAFRQAARYMKRKSWGSLCDITGPDTNGVVYVDTVDP